MSRLVATSTALALGASLLVAPNALAAQVEAPKPLSGGELICNVTYTPGEKAEAWKDFQQAQTGLIDAILDGWDAIYPGTKTLAVAFRNDPSVKKNVGTLSPWTSEEAQALWGPYVREISALGVRPVEAEKILRHTVKPALWQGPIDEEFTRYFVYQNANAATPSRQEARKSLAGSYGPSNATDAQKNTFANAFFANGKADRFLDARDVYDQLTVKAMKACAAGGKQTIQLKNLDPTAFDKDPSAGSAADVFEGSSAERGAGELSPGAIAGIVIAILAVVGIVAVAAAPMLGIPLPF